MAVIIKMGRDKTDPFFIPSGTYGLKIEEVELKPPKEGKEHARLMVTCKIIGTSNENMSKLGDKTWIWLNLGEKSHWTIASLVAAAGLDYEEEEAEDGSMLDTFDAEELVGCKLNAVSSESTYKKKTRSQWGARDFEEFDASVHDQLDDEAEEEETESVEVSAEATPEPESDSKPPTKTKRRRKKNTAAQDDATAF